MAIRKVIVSPVHAVPQQIEANPSIWDPPSVGEWVKTVIDCPEWLLKGLLPADSVIIMSGKAKIAHKSWFAFIQAMSVASGKTIGPFEPVEKAGQPVLILEAEGGRAQTRNRWLWLAKSQNIDLDTLPNLRFSHRENIVLDDGTSDWPDKINDCIERLGVKFIIVDPFAMFFTGDENRVQDVAKIMRTFTRFRQSGASVMFLHHLAKTDPKFAKDIDEEMRGSTALPGFYDLHQAIRKRKANQEHLDAIFRFKDDEQQFFDLEFFIDKHAGTADFKLLASTQEGSFGRFAEEMTAHMIPGSEYSRQRLIEMAEMDEVIARDLIDWMVEQGVLEHAAKGLRLKGKSNELAGIVDKPGSRTEQD